MGVVFVEVKKLKFDYEKLKNKSFLGKVKTSLANIQKSIFNNTHEVMQETLMNGYYYAFFKKLKKEVDKGLHDNLVDVEILENTMKKVRVKVSMLDLNHKNNGLNMLQWCLHDIKLSDAFSRTGKEKKLKKIKKKMTDNFAKSVKKENKGKRFRMNKVKKYFKNIWEKNINKDIGEVCARFSLSVILK